MGIEIQGYDSPAIRAQLAQTHKHNDLVSEHWRALVDCVAIDPTYDGQVFRPLLVDAPLRKRDQIMGNYVMSVPTQPICVAVRIIDVLGEELLVTKWI